MTSAERWDRIDAILDEMRAMSEADGQARPGTRRAKNVTPYYERPEHRVLQRELREMSDIERDAALDEGLPVWQAGQHFDYRDEDGRDMQGTAKRIDLDARTVTAMTWDPDEPCAELFSDRHVSRVIPFDRLLPYAYHSHKMQAQGDAERAAQARAAEAVAMPLFADLD